MLRLLPDPIAPSLIAEMSAPEGTCVLYHRVKGQPWKNGVSDVACLIRRLHGFPIPQGLRHTANGSSEIITHALQILDLCQDAQSLTNMRPQGVNVARTRDVVLLHGDLVAGNIIRHDHGLGLIDWQCPAVGDPCEDIAMFLSPAMQVLYRGTLLSKADTTAFLEAYDCPTVTSRYQALAPWYHWRMAAYCLWQSQRGNVEYAAAQKYEQQALFE